VAEGDVPISNHLAPSSSGVQGATPARRPDRWVGEAAAFVAAEATKAGRSLI